MPRATTLRQSRERPDGPRPYALGYAGAEFDRLERQGSYYRDLTRDVLVRAGIGPGMRVLDVGCGVGDVSLLAARLVGPTGSVHGVDRSPEAIAVAARRVAREALLARVTFAAVELGDWDPEPGFDAVIGRLILMYLPDPGAALARLSAGLRPGGIVAFQEIATGHGRSVPEGPLFRACCRWLVDTFERAGFESDMAAKLPAVFRAAGLPPPEMIAAARVEAGPTAYAYDYLAATLRSLLPVGERVGAMDPAEVGIDTLADRLRAEALAADACIILPTLVGAWTRLPPAPPAPPRETAP
ncbi:methyltransferase domain-containing protein [Amaricoccus sp.]|uniref:class I SAM-dependent methyltransferase n=1 Tax=Amaricoccus sp. TaxID=1872485 RepID=UPI001B4E9564|nr:methyltransferase domain-containing protein [Amaricoccus sp.]MBP7001650.1 class I SAM-dependent methyltransferase [Amaricoccus sp.]